MKAFIHIIFLLIAFQATAQDKYTFVFLHHRTDLPALPKEESDKLMEGHMANIQKMAKDGNLIAAGPLEGGGGIFIFKPSTPKEVEEWISHDPGIQAKRWNIEMLKYEPLVGGVCVASPPYEMTMYTFVQFKPKVYKFNVQEAGETVENHNKFIKQLSAGGNVIAYGSFGGKDGGVLVMKGDVQQEVILQSPAVTAALFEPEFKKLYIAKGAFCEK
ncbi:MAG: YciI family protein [Bacteroidota bacterium]